MHSAPGLDRPRRRSNSTSSLRGAGAGDVGSQALGVGEFFEHIIEAVYSAILQPGDSAIDDGSSLGRHTFPMRARVGNTGLVIAVEPPESPCPDQPTPGRLNQGPACAEKNPAIPRRNSDRASSAACASVITRGR